MDELAFYKGKRVFVTGHTGFKGSWLCKILAQAGAEVTGYALDSPTDPALFRLADIARDVRSVKGDVRDFDSLQKAFRAAKPEIVFHLAAQPIVRESYKNPVFTYATNIMGTVHLLECVRLGDSVRSLINVTTDKVYWNREWTWGYRENEELNGFDPYSNSKSCSELVTGTYRNCFFSGEASRVAISTVRAGNVIGGGDFAADRIIPDCVRAALNREPISVRNPNSVRPYQHVLDPLFVYLMIAERQYADPSLAGAYNVGPDEADCRRTGDLVDLFLDTWGEGLRREDASFDGPHEANFLKLDCSKLRSVFGWKARWRIETGLQKVVEWSKCYRDGGDVRACMERQIASFLS